MRFTIQRASLAARLLVVLTSLLLAQLACVASSRASSSCPNELFRTGPGASLPDCRAYEMVSPPDKNGGEVDGGPAFLGTPPAPQQAASDGEAVTYGAQTTFTEANPLSSMLTTQYISRRGPTGWSTQAIDPEQNQPGGVFNREAGAIDFSLFDGFNEDLSRAFLLAYEPSPVAGAPAKYYNPYVRNNLENTYTLLSPEKPPVQRPGVANVFEGFRADYAGMSTDGSRVVFEANDKLTPGAVPGMGNLYESNDGQLELVSVLPTGEVVGGGEGSGNLAFGRIAPDQGYINEGDVHAISRDGSRAFWTFQEYSRSGHLEAQIYMHELISGGARTVHVSASHKTNGTGPGGSDPNGPKPAFYKDASSDGNEVFFTSCEQLTNDSTAGGNCAEAGDLYRYEVDTGRLADLSVDSVPGQSASVENVLGASEDGSSIYFVAHGALVPGAPSGPSTFNIYLSRDGKLSLVASLNSTDYTTSTVFENENTVEGNDVRVSPNGRYLTFESVEPLTGYDTKPLQENACETLSAVWGVKSQYADHTGRCIEVYEYDAETGRLVCASCNPRGLPPVGDSVEPMALHTLTHYAGWESTTVQQHYLLDNGRLFFDSTEALLPQASDGRLNVYEYEPDEVGGCRTEGGCVALISGGTSGSDSLFLDASTSGDDVFFLTRQQLVAADGDEALDVYDARVDGGFSPAVAAPCGGEACRPPVTPAPAIYGAPPSATFVGAGNPPQPAAASPVVKSKKKKQQVKRKSQAKRRRKKRRARGAHVSRSSRGSRR